MRLDGIWFKDDDGRTLILRGANLGGSSKVPFRPDGATYRAEGFFDHRQVSFVGRPFPLQEADEHFSRLRAWGLTFLRFLITWEAIEHAGPGQYDEEYLDYLRAVIQKAAQHGIQMFIDPHQDVWSRWTGGDGAPGWTLEAVGMDLRKLHTTGAAISHATHGDPFPRMIWPSNSTKLGAATMFTLFFGGNDFLPATKIDGQPAQEYLQSHYINAVKQVVERLKDLPNVVGYDSLNEPGAGFLGAPDLARETRGLLRLGESPTPFQAMLLGAGYPQEVDVVEMSFEGFRVVGKKLLNPNRDVLWRDGYECPFKANGVWTDEGGEPRLLRPDHFACKPDGNPVDAPNDYMKPFIKRFMREMRAIDPNATLFLEGVPEGGHPTWTADDGPNAVHAAHWYDGMTLILKMFRPDFNVDRATNQPVMGEEAVQALFTRQVGKAKSDTIPSLLGEFGAPFDMNDREAYRTGDFTPQTQALTMYYNALDANLLSSTIWNYTADNTNARGEMWNDEDLSIFSRDQQTKPWTEDIHSGGRAAAGFVRPYAMAVAGEPLRMAYDLNTRTFELAYRRDPAVSAPTEIFVPSFVYPNGYRVEAAGASFTEDLAAQCLFVWANSADEVQTVRITPA